MSEDRQLDIQKFLVKGQEARYSLYLNYLREIASGGTLSSDQVKTMKQLEEEFRTRLSEQSSDDKPPQEPVAFPNLLAVLSHLQAAGYRVSKSTLYNHARKGLLKRNDSGEYSAAAVDRYAAGLVRLNGQSVTPEQKRREKIELEKAEVDLARLREQAAHWANRNRKIEEEITAIIGRELARRYRFFRSDIRNFHRGDVLSIIALVEGNPEKAPDLVDYLDQKLEAWLGRYASMKTIEIGPIAPGNDLSEAM